MAASALTERYAATEVVEFGQARQEWFATFLTLPNGIPKRAGETLAPTFAPPLLPRLQA